MAVSTSVVVLLGIIVFVMIHSSWVCLWPPGLRRGAVASWVVSI
ncbi:hypothetical protein [Streptomyces sp. NRRL F-5755]|nr:hypothetical protein [Streptomyces sp. NRRL F-5755]